MAKLAIEVIVSELFQENAYLVCLPHRDDCLIVDPGLDFEAMIQRIEGLNRNLAAVINTHGHADHIAGNAALKARWPEAPIVIGAKEAIKLVDPVQNLSRSYGIDITSPKADVLVSEGDTYTAAGIELEVLETPGHSAGHVIFVWKAISPWVVFGGDVLFRGGVGRTDFPDGSFEELETAIRTKLYTLPDDTVILPGHGAITTIEFEKANNPFVSA